MSGDQLITLIKPELLVLVPVLIIIGMTLKKTSIIKDWSIPMALGGLGMVFSVLILGFNNGFNPSVILDGMLQGILSAGMSVYIHQLTIQTTIKRLRE